MKLECAICQALKEPFRALLPSKCQSVKCPDVKVDKNLSDILVVKTLVIQSWAIPLDAINHTSIKESFNEGAMKCSWVNITVGVLEERMMLSGMHTVADIFCCCCGGIIGWKYDSLISLFPSLTGGSTRDESKVQKKGSLSSKVFQSELTTNIRKDRSATANITMGKEDIKLMKLEEINKEDSPEELEELGAATLLLCCLMHTRVNYKTTLALDKLKSNTLAVQNKSNISAADRNLPGVSQHLNLEFTFKIIDDYVSSEVPSIPGINGHIGNSTDAQNYLNPFLNTDEKVVEGIEVITYDPNGKEFEMGRSKKKKDIRRKKSKRLRRHDASCSDDDSKSSLSVSSFDSDDSFRSRRSRPRTKKDVKGSKKRARSSSSEERKRKGSKRNGERKKMHEKKTKTRRKKGRRDSSVRSSSSESWSCSSCQNLSSQSDESEYERFKAKPERRGDEKRKSENIGSGAKGKRYRSGSCSSCSRHDDSSDFLLSNIMTGENTSKRLRSIIILPGEDSEVREQDNDKHKEEITYDHDDYPYSRSNDSNDGLNNMEERSIENEKREDAAASNSKAIELTESNEFGEGQHARNKPGYEVDRAGAEDTKKKNNDFSGVVNTVNGDDLETVLRQKALENLKSFRSGLGGFQTNAKSAVIQKDKYDGTVQSPFSMMPELGQTKTPKVVGSRMARENSAQSSLNEKIPDGGICGTESCTAKNNVHPPDQVAIPAREKGSTYASFSKNKPGLITSASRKALSNVTSTLKETPTSQETNQPKLASGTCLGSSVTLKETPASREANQAKMSIGISLGKIVTLKETPLSLEAIQGKLASGSEVCENAIRVAHTVTPPTDTDNDDKANNSSVSDPAETSSFLKSAAGDINLNESQDGGKEGAQLEQKTMSVMRGGELVQVKYKVYIPKKTPALARRQLKR
ncbi:hypothetical protein SADUNF_Sadunf11G0079300 [Salix dunnii]|uniref:Yippee domain-containing protein n=1 Tax=Salix dunnii TaxID=1413687 RepID=A0A835JTM2_9ROSI|nr:hypothetical protein SADUNF_Sadunf11G0079300 [Salix dunnii]